MRVLIVDDDTVKVRRVVDILVSAGVDVSSIDECRNGFAARELLRSRNYDLLVLDMVLPERIDAEPKADVGSRLLAEIHGRSRYHMPDHIVGLTAYPEVHRDSKGEFLGFGLLLLRYSHSDEEWADALRNKAERIIWARESARMVTCEYQSQLAVVCALDDP